VSGSFAYDQTTAAYVPASSTLIVSGETGSFAELNGMYDGFYGVESLPALIVFIFTSVSANDIRYTIAPNPPPATGIDLPVDQIEVEGPTRSDNNTAATLTATTVGNTAPAPVAGAGIPGLLAGVGAFLFWRGRTAAMAFVRRRQRSCQPVAS